MLLALLAACSPSSEPPATQQPPPPLFELDVSAAAPGGLVRLSVVSDLAPGARVQFLAALTRGPALCPPALGGACVRLEQPRVLGSGVVDVQGEASWDLVLPASMPVGRQVVFQAVSLRPGQRASVSAPTSTRLTGLDEDPDADGLRNNDEIAAGTFPGVPDSDGGGIFDGQEVLFDLTDPTDPLDDVAGETDCANLIDDDGDFNIDCDDPDCLGSVGCGESTCDDGVDDDGNGLVDCEDPGCLGSRFCEELDCDDGVDNDLDGLADCDDEDCWSADCHDYVVAWVSSVRSATIGRNGLAATGVLGQVWVQGPLYPLGQTCSWTVSSARDGGREGAQVGQGCAMDVGFLPDPASLVERADGAITMAGGAVWYGASAYDTSYRPGGDPTGSCPSGVATLYYLDRDGDGFGVDAFDLFSEPGGRRWTCGAPPAGSTLVGGDCDDTDPAWNPVDVVIDPNWRCTDLLPWDRDGDGVDAIHDPDDLNWSVR